MAAIGKVIEGVLPPVGNPISLNASEEIKPLFSGFKHVYVQSGTAALALALKLCSKSSKPGKSKVIIPAYACPDLISAIVFAGLEPVLVDLFAGKSCFDLESLVEEIDESVLAIIAVNFLGIREQIDVLRQLPTVKLHDVTVIEDSAQWFPENIALDQLADMVCLSFGRGKPVSLLGGGLLLVRSSADIDVDVLIEEEISFFRRLIFSFKIVAYNLILQPFCYQLLARNPFIELGVTKYKQLMAIKGFPSYLQRKLESNVERYLSLSRHHEQLLAEGLTNQRVRLLPENQNARMLRFTLLFTDKQERDCAYEKLNTAGLGATKLYEKPLNEFSDVQPFLSKNSMTKTYPNAKCLSEKMLTLPLHNGVSRKSVFKMLSILNQLETNSCSS